MNKTPTNTQTSTKKILIKPFQPKYPAPSPKPVKQKAGSQYQEHNVIGWMCNGGLVIFEIEKDYNGSGAFMADLKAHKHLLSTSDEMQFVSFGMKLDANGNSIPLHSNTKYPREVAVCFLNAEGDAILPAMEAQGKAYAKIFQQTARPFTNASGKVVGKPIRAAWAYAKSLDPKILSEVIGKRGASEAIARMYRPYLVDGSFSDHSADIIPTYFKNVDVEEGLRMVELAHARILEEETEEAGN